MSHYEISSYFTKRAPRYQAALRALPLARLLDLLPYAAAIQCLELHGQRSVRVADAFGGTGFLANGLKRAGFTFVVCDCCQAMLTGASDIPNTLWRETADDFRSVLTEFGEDTFDLVLSHGGLHHVVDTTDGVPDHNASRKRQLQIVQRLARMVRQDGALIISDIPDTPPLEVFGRAQEVMLREPFLKDLLGEEATAWIQAAIRDASLYEIPLGFLQEYLRTELTKTVPFPVPRYFFDNFVASTTSMGHVAVYPDFDELHELLEAEGFSSIGRMNYCGPWLFQSEANAGWFYREKFSVGTPSRLGERVEGDIAMYKNLEHFLGTRNAKGFVAVNWGVTYAMYQKAFRR